MKISIYIILAIFSLSIVARANSPEIGAGARAPGMAEAFVAVADDVYSLYYNPAGLTQINNLEMTTQHGEFLKGLTDGSKVESNYLAFAKPLKNGQRGVLGFAVQNFTGANYFKDRIISVGYGWKLDSKMFKETGLWSSGVAVKQVHREYEPDLYTGNALNDTGIGSGQRDPHFEGKGFSDDTLAMDVGTLTRFGLNNRFSAGGAVMNIGQTMQIKTGLSYHSQWGLLTGEVRRSKRLESKNDTDMAMGVERELPFGNWGGMTLRGGYAQGSRDFKKVTTGISIGVASIKMDYSFDFPLGNLSTTQGDHRIALTFKMGPPTAISNSLTQNSPAQDYRASLNHYLARKAEGASTDERLSLLQSLYAQFGQSGVDLTWLSTELSAL